VERPPNEEEQSEQGRVLRFPRLWVPPDGIEPLVESHAEPEPAGGADGKTLEADNEGSPSERPAFEAGGFWERGDMQEFVGVAVGSAPSTTSSDDADATSGAGGEEMSPSSLEAPTTNHNGDGIAVRDLARARYAWAKLAGLAVLVLGVLVGGGIALAAALQLTPQPRREAAAPSGSHRAPTEGTRLAVTGAVVLPAINSRRLGFAAKQRSRTQTAHKSSRPAHQAPPATAVQPVRYAQPTPATGVAASSSSESSSASGAPAQSSASAQVAQSPSAGTAEPQPQNTSPAAPTQPAASTSQPAHPSPLGGLAWGC
jgi:hypothetical protein